MAGIKDLYGVLKGKVIRYEEGDAKTDPDKPHVYIYVNFNDKEYKVAVNTKSYTKKPIIINDKKVPNDLLYIANPNFCAEQITNLQKLTYGFFPIKYHNKFVYDRLDYPSNIPVDFPEVEYNPEYIAVDFVRSKLFDPCQMKIMPSNKIGHDNDLADFFQKHIENNAIKNNATIYVYGGHFNNGEGIHEVHMNQGSIGQYEKSNGVYQDGCIFLEYPDKHWEAIFLAFQSQTWKTNDETGKSEGNSFIYDHKTGKNICDINN